MNEVKDTLNNVLVNLFNQVLSIEEKYLSKVGITLTINEIHLLDRVRSSETKTMGDIAKALGVTQSTLSITSKRLVKKGLLVRERDNTDKRIIRLFLTEEAEANLIKHDEFHKHMIDSIVEQISTEDQLYLQQSLNSLVEFFYKNY